MARTGLIHWLHRPRLVCATYRAVDRLARRQGLTLILVALSGFLASAAFSLRAIPQPGVHDEYGYLLAADTFAAGRLTNPSHPFWPHFESMHIIQQPTYMAKYPPGQGLVLALGQILTGYPIVGVWISIAAACAAACWLLQGWLRPRWALLGGLLAVLWLAPSYWAQGYWGGAVAACGGGLVYGALPRIVRQRHWWAGFHLGLGLAMLLYSRPYEGLIVSLPAAMVLLAWLAQSGIRGAVALGLPVMLATLTVLTPAAAWLASYHAAVTGDPLVMPYRVHDAAYAACPTFLWQSLGPQPIYHHQEMADYYAGWELPRFERKSAYWGLNASAATKLWVFLKFYVGVAFLLPLLVLWRNCRNRWYWLAASTCGLAVLAMIATLYLHPHYVAPITALVLVQVTAGLKRLHGWRWKGRHAGRWLSAAVVAICLLGYAVPLGRTWLADDRPGARQEVMQQLEGEGQRHLVFVRYSANHDCHEEWVFNRADIDGSTVIWAREISPGDDRQLREYCANRKAWVLIADEKPPRLLPYDDVAVASYPRRQNRYLLQASNTTAVVR